MPFFDFIQKMYQAPSSSVQVLIWEDKLDYLNNPSKDFKNYFCLWFLWISSNAGGQNLEVPFFQGSIWQMIMGRFIAIISNYKNRFHFPNLTFGNTYEMESGFSIVFNFWLFACFHERLGNSEFSRFFITVHNNFCLCKQKVYFVLSKTQKIYLPNWIKNCENSEFVFSWKNMVSSSHHLRN